MISISPIIKENTTPVVAACQNNISLLWHKIGKKITGLGIMTLNPEKI